MTVFDPRRRRALGALGAVAGAVALSGIGAPPARSAPAVKIRAAPARVWLVVEPHPGTEVWSYNGTVPGPELRVKQGARLRVEVENALGEGTTIHWHGVRVPNAMDGVPHLTQAPIAANGGTFVYEFDAPDAGTYWYHPHSRSYEQVDRGLYGVLIVEEHTPPPVDRDVVWVLDDWRLNQDAQIRDDFAEWFDVTHAGRIGNTVTVNGVVADSFDVRAGERIRLRLVNAANARIFGLEFRGHRPWIVALDAQPVEPHEPAGGLVVLGPSMRVDLVIDMDGQPRERHAVFDGFYRGRGYRLLDLAYTGEPPLRSGARGAPLALPPNPLSEPDLARAERHEMRMSGGMMSMDWPSDPWPARAARRARRLLGSREVDPVWAMDGVAHTGENHAAAPAHTFKRGTSVILRLRNDTAWHHPMHLHGHVFRVLARNGAPTRFREWQDTVLLGPRESADIAVVADNPGDWMLHCHVLEHQAGGMMSVIRVA